MSAEGAGRAAADQEGRGLARLLEDEGPAAWPACVALYRAAKKEGDADACMNAEIAEKKILSRCALCGTELGASPSVCGGCRAVAYCSKECAKKHWKKKGGHKQECKEHKKYLPEKE